MKFADFLPSNAIIKELKSAGKKEAIKEMVEKIKSVFSLKDFKINEVVENLMQREKIGSTGIGNGIAVPHAKIDGLKKVVGVFGRSSSGIEFNAIDGSPVHLMFLILAPADNPEINLQTLQHISRSIKQPNFCKFLKNAKDVKSIVEVLREADESLK